jgi:hypothetical protein
VRGCQLVEGGHVRSGCWPIVSNGAAERFTQAVRMPAALASAASRGSVQTPGFGGQDVDGDVAAVRAGFKAEAAAQR